MDKTASLTSETQRIITDKATEYPHSGSYNRVLSEGSYLCRRCGLALFRANSQFDAGCGWPSFDEPFSDKVLEKLDRDGLRVEILCQRCQAHLGHVFRGEFLTGKNCRYCVNSASLDFVKDEQVEDSEEAIVAGGCFWGVEYLFAKCKGVLKTETGYTGGSTRNPDYQQVCLGQTGHYEALRILYDPTITDYRAILQYFFEIHDFTQANGQGPDLGSQYQSAIFYYDTLQQQTAASLIEILKNKGYSVATVLKPVQTFWPAEDYHQNYYGKNSKQPYCHRFRPLFDSPEDK